MSLKELETDLASIPENEEGIALLLQLTEKYHIELELEGAFSISDMKQFVRAAYISQVSSDPERIEPGMRPFMTRHVINGKQYDFPPDGGVEL